MGLGKTSITLYAIKDLIDEFSVNRILIIAPLYVAKDTWPREADKWDFASSLSISVACGTPAQRMHALESSSDIVVINRENVIWMCNTYGMNLAKMFDMLVIDESSSFKSSSSQRFKKLRKITPNFSRIVELTGTPRPRSLEDLYPQIYLLDHGTRLGKTMTAFRAVFEHPGRVGPNNVVFTWEPRDGAEKAVYERLSDISMSMSAKDYLDVPEMQVIDHKFDLSPANLAQYKQLEKQFILDDTIVANNAGVLAGKLLQFANGAVYDENEDVKIYHDDKIKILHEIMESTSEPVMVFYWFKFDLPRLLESFKEYKPVKLSSKIDLQKWNEGRIRMTLVHPASMGHGLNLQDGGHIIVWYGLTWSLEIYQQANARLHRQGQRNTVQVHRIVASGTIDEDVINSLNRKNVSQNELLDAIKARVMKDMEVDQHVKR